MDAAASHVKKMNAGNTPLIDASPTNLNQLLFRKDAKIATFCLFNSNLKRLVLLAKSDFYDRYS